MQPFKFILTRSFAISALLVGAAPLAAFGAPVADKRCSALCCAYSCLIDTGKAEDAVSSTSFSSSAPVAESTNPATKIVKLIGLAVPDPKPSTGSTLIDTDPDADLLSDLANLDPSSSILASPAVQTSTPPSTPLPVEVVEITTSDSDDLLDTLDELL